MNLLMYSTPSRRVGGEVDMKSWMEAHAHTHINRNTEWLTCMSTHSEPRSLKSCFGGGFLKAAAFDEQTLRSLKLYNGARARRNDEILHKHSASGGCLMERASLTALNYERQADRRGEEDADTV